MHPFPSTTLKLPPYFILFSPGGDTHTTGMIPGGPICPGVGSGQLIWGHCHVAEVGSGKLPGESSLSLAISAFQLESSSPWDGFPHKINVLSELILFLKGESHHIVKTDHKKTHQCVRETG